MTKYEIILYWSNEDQAFIAEVPELAGCAADGLTRQEALANAETVIAEWIETARELAASLYILEKGKGLDSRACSGYSGFRDCLLARRLMHHRISCNFSRRAGLRINPRPDRTEAHLGAGRRRKLKAVQTVTITGKASLLGGQMEAAVTMRVKRPTSMRMEMSMQGKIFVQAFDGGTAWIVNPFAGGAAPQESNEEDTKAARDDAEFIDGSLVDYKLKGNALELVGKESVKGSPAYKLKVTKKSGTVEYQYLDAKTFLPVKSSGKRIQQGQELEYESFPGNFKDVNGVMMPYSLTQKMSGIPLMELTVEKVEVNIPMDASIFKMPK